jgi:hypothetical protein
VLRSIRPALSRSLVLTVAAFVAASALALEPDARAATGGLTSATAGKWQVQRSAPAARACRKGASGRRCKTRPRARVAIRNGYTPHASQWPWVARIAPMGCGGTLIRPNVVLTAAHCVMKDGRLGHAHDGVTVILGRRTLSDTSVGEEIRTDRIVVHESFAGVHTDVALLHLWRPSSMQPAQLGQADDWRSPATVMGWGGTEYGSRPAQSNVLWAADLPLLSDAFCAARSPVPYDGSVMLCAGANGSGSHKGDSGGPLMVGDGYGGGWELIGVVSFGNPEGDVVNTPSYFAWASGPTLRPWIEQNADALASWQPATPRIATDSEPVRDTVPVDRTAPALMTVAMWPNRFRAARRGPAVASASAVGTTVRYRVSEAASTTFKVVRCENRRCTRRRAVGSVRHTARAGLNRFAFTGRVRGRRLRPGSYRLIGRALDAAGNRSVAEKLSFRVLR